MDIVKNQFKYASISDLCFFTGAVITYVTMGSSKDGNQVLKYMIYISCQTHVVGLTIQRYLHKCVSYITKTADNYSFFIATFILFSNILCLLLVRRGVAPLIEGFLMHSSKNCMLSLRASILVHACKCF